MKSIVKSLLRILAMLSIVVTAVLVTAQWILPVVTSIEAARKPRKMRGWFRENCPITRLRLHPGLNFPISATNLRCHGPISTVHEPELFEILCS